MIPCLSRFASAAILLMLRLCLLLTKIKHFEMQPFEALERLRQHVYLICYRIDLIFDWFSLWSEYHMQNAFLVYYPLLLCTNTGGWIPEPKYRLIPWFISALLQIIKIENSKKLQLKKYFSLWSPICSCVYLSMWHEFKLLDLLNWMDGLSSRLMALPPLVGECVCKWVKVTNL